MSGFILVIPDDWTIIPRAMIDQLGINTIVVWIQTSDYYTLGQALREIGGPESMSEAVFFNSEVLAVR